MYWIFYTYLGCLLLVTGLEPISFFAASFCRTGASQGSEGNKPTDLAYAAEDVRIVLCKWDLLSGWKSGKGPSVAAARRRTHILADFPPARVVVPSQICTVNDNCECQVGLCLNSPVDLTDLLCGGFVRSQWSCSLVVHRSCFLSHAVEG